MELAAEARSDREVVPVASQHEYAKGAMMHIESVTIRNFRCFGSGRTRIALDPAMTALIGNNGSGKTAACQALQRVFGISTDERSVRVDDFHVPADESTDAGVTSRDLTVDVVLAFPELDQDGQDDSAVPDFFRRMCALDDGTLKCRVVLEALWTADGTVDGSIETTVKAVTTLSEEYGADEAFPLSAAERSRIQFVYVPASRDGARQVTAFLRGRLWRGAQWSSDLRELVEETATRVGEQFHDEGAAQVVEAAFGTRWKQLHGAGTHSTLRFQPVAPDIEQFVKGAELTFEPDHTATARPARLLSDGQRSILHLALTTASLDIEATLVADPQTDRFDVPNTHLPALTVLAVEEPENNLSPFYLSRIVGQLLELGGTSRVQVLLSSHSPSAMSRVEPSSVRHFRLDDASGAVTVRPILLPPDDTEAGTYVREAVRAHPELYFARFVLLGEGDSEQIVLPAIARARGLDLDPSFVAMVPLGGRHTQHFWRLLTDLCIPHATLLDLDYGRAGGGAGRLRTACALLESFGIAVFEGVTGFAATADLVDTLRLRDLKPVREALRSHGVFFSSPLDLDMLMLRGYWDAYTELEAGERGPRDTDATAAVLGIGGSTQGRAFWTSEDERREQLRWYRYLFGNRSKPATHLRAVSRLTDVELAECPEELGRLLEFIREHVES